MFSQFPVVSYFKYCQIGGLLRTLKNHLCPHQQFDFLAIIFLRDFICNWVRLFLCVKYIVIGEERFLKQNPKSTNYKKNPLKKSEFLV